MKQLRIDVDEEMHTAIKTEAAQQSLSIRDFVLSSLAVGTATLTRGRLETPEATKKLNTRMLRIVKDPARADEVIKEMVDEGMKTCRNNHPIIRGNKCAAKGCKYNVYSK